eukprot:TRINITY_DN15558_c0_g1_i1.p1 TRINITY_DN15558_c0_g1~~TRINITY_DN15558_c0_g1_i1.p1  ORF type:complete len:470 (+),score=73.52 TRINITY_DN15558_c0_g1_i1:53-1462(+)
MFRSWLPVLLPTICGTHVEATAEITVSSSARVDDTSLYPSFEEYLERFGKNYQLSELEMRRAEYEKRLAEIHDLNAREGVSWKAGVNKFTDSTAEDRLKRRRPRTVSVQQEQTPMTLASSTFSKTSLPRSKSWRWATGKVLNEGDCGGCWAVTVVSCIQGHAAISTGVHVALSEQQLVDCAVEKGCKDGAAEETAFEYVMKAGLTERKYYPYDSGHNGGKEGKCKMGVHGPKPVVGITGYRNLPSNDEHALLTALVTLGPVIVGVDAHKHWDYYMGGIFDACSKTKAQVDHDVLLIGYGEDGGTEYWLIQNSWDTDWGEKGLMRIRRHRREPCMAEHGGEDACGTCGLLSDALYPTGVFLYSDHHSHETGHSHEHHHHHHHPSHHHHDGDEWHGCAHYGCGADYDPRQSCHCNSLCMDYGNCCADYWRLCKKREAMLVDSFSEQDSLPASQCFAPYVHLLSGAGPEIDH